MSRYKATTEAQERQICRLFHQGETAANLAELYGLSNPTIYRILRDGGAKRPQTRNKPVYKEEKLIALFKQGKTLREIGSKYGISGEWVRKIVKKHGLTPKDGGQYVKSLETKKRRATREKARKDAIALRRYGLLHAEAKKHKRKDKLDFCRQKGNAKSRGIPWKLTLSEWVDIWKQSRKRRWRGRQYNSYVLTRRNGAGAFSVDNCFVTKLHESSRNYALNHHGVNYNPPH